VTNTFLAPSTLEEALAALASDQQAAVVAGGTDIVVAGRSGKTPLPERIVAIHRVAGLDAIEAAGEGLRLGALVTHAQIESSPVIRARYTALADAAALVGSPATRHVGTIGGNVVNASPAVETGSPLLVFEAEARLRGRMVDAAALSYAAEASAPAARPIDDVRASADYRRAMTVVIARRALESAWRRALGSAA